MAKEDSLLNNPQAPVADRDRSTIPVRETRPFLVRGGVTVDIEVKTLLEHRLVIACNDTPVDGEDPIRKGAVGMRREEDGVLRFQFFDGGVFDALIALDRHIPDGYQTENADLEVARGSWAYAIQRCWTTTKHSSRADIKAYHDAVMLGVTKLGAAPRDERKRTAKEAGTRASDHKDRTGRVNFGSRPLIIWKADQAVRDRIAATHDISPKIDLRKWTLIAALDRAFDLVDSAEQTVLQALTLWGKPRRFTKDRAMTMAADFEGIATTFEHVSLAPFSRRALPHIARELRQAAECLRMGNRDRAQALLDRVVRAFTMTRARRMLEEVRVEANAFRSAEAAKEIRTEDVNGLVAALEQVEKMLVVDGTPIDHDFERPVIARSVLPMLMVAKGATRNVGFYQGEAVYKSIESAAAPL